jgi:hypothetical protein
VRSFVYATSQNASRPHQTVHDNDDNDDSNDDCNDDNNDDNDDKDDLLNLKDTHAFGHGVETLKDAL